MATPVPSHEGSSHPTTAPGAGAADRRRRGATTLQQIRALVWKDGVSMRRHYICLGAELIVPIAAAVVAWLLLDVFVALPGLSLLRGAQENAITYNEYSYGACSNFNAAAPPSFAAQVNGIARFTPGFPCGGEFDDAPNASTAEQIKEAFVSQGYSYYFGFAIAKSLFPSAAEPSAVYTVLYAVSNYLTSMLEDFTESMMYLENPQFEFQGKYDIVAGFITNQRFKRNEYQMFATFAAWVMAFAHIPLSSSLAGRLVDEKRNRVREHLKVLGVRPQAYLASVITTASLRIAFNALATLVTVAVTLHAKLGAGDVVFVAAAQLLFGFSLCAFGTVLPAFISRSQIAIGVIAVYICAFAIGAAFLTDLPDVAVRSPARSSSPPSPSRSPSPPSSAAAS